MLVIYQCKWYPAQGPYPIKQRETLQYLLHEYIRQILILWVNTKMWIILAAVFVARQRLDIIPVQQSCFAQTEAGHMTSSWPRRWWVAEVGPELLPSPAHKVNYNECLSQTPFAHWYLALGCGVLFLGQKMVMLGSGQCRNRLVFPQHGLIELALAVGRSYCGTRPACRAQHWIVLTYALDTFVFKNLLLKALC